MADEKKPEGQRTGKDGRKLCQSFIDHQFKPGQSGNPAGPPKGRKLSDILRKELAKNLKHNKKLQNAAVALGLTEKDAPDELLESITLADLIVMATLMHAIRGDAAILKQVWERIEGKVPDRIAGPEGEPLGQDVIGRVMANPEAMAMAIKLANLTEKDKPDDNGSGNRDGDGSGPAAD